MNTPLRATQIVRKIMREHGKHTIFTNKLVSSRTVKCYVGILSDGRSGVSADDARMVKAITKALSEAGVKDTAVRYTVADPHSYLSRGAIIIQVPL